MATAKHFDVIISGAGLSGLLTAIGLLTEAPHLSLAIVEPYHSDKTTDLVANFDDRCLALSYGSLQLLNHWQIWPLLKPSAWPIKTIITSDRGHLGKTIMRAEDYQLNAMGYVAAMRNMGTAFSTRLEQLQQTMPEQLQWHCPNTIASVEQGTEHVSVTLDNGTQLCGNLLVVAEGGNSPTREKINIGISKSEYQQAAVISNITVRVNPGLDKTLSRKNEAKVSDYAAFERFTLHGPIAFLPIGKGQYSVVWSVPPEQIEQVLALSQAEFCQQLQQAFGTGAGEIIKATKAEAYPLALVKAESMVHQRVALVGNAGHTVHPIAGQGFNLGLRDIAVLVKEIAQVATAQGDIGSFELLQEYQAQREQDINRITGFTDLLVRTFSIEGRLAAGSRTLALQALQKCDSLQQWLALHFMSSKSNY